MSERKPINEKDAHVLWDYLIDQNQKQATQFRFRDAWANNLNGQDLPGWYRVDDYMVRKLGVITVPDDPNASFIVGHAVDSAGVIKPALIVGMWTQINNAISEVTPTIFLELLLNSGLEVREEELIIQICDKDDTTIFVSGLIFINKKSFTKFLQAKTLKL